MQLGSLSIQSLQCFLVAGETLNFRQAARRLHLSPSAFGQRIRQLEEQLEVCLFQRTTRQVSLSDAGRRLFPEVARLLLDISKMHALAHDKQAPTPQSLTIGTRHELGLSWLSPMLPALESSVPGLTLHLHFGSEFWSLLESGGVDAVVSSARLPSRRFAFHQLHEERYVLVAAASLVGGNSPIRRIAHLAEHVLVDTGPSLPLTHYWLDADPQHAHIQFLRCRYMGTIAAVRAHILRGEGVAVLPEYFVKADLKAQRLRRLFANRQLLSDHFRLVYSPERVEAGLAQQIATVMQNTPLQ